MGNSPPQIQEILNLKLQALAIGGQVTPLNSPPQLTPNSYHISTPQWQRSLSTIRGMATIGLQANSVEYTAAMRSLSTAREWERAMQ
eukprot:1320573-Amorphochlora_amoeboformis.AAC.1